MPEIDIGSLRKILELEQKKGCSDSAVIGGLDKFIRQWADKTIEVITAPSLLAKFQKLHLRDSKYASLTPKQREAWIKNILAFAAELESGKTAKPAPIRNISVKLEKPALKPKTAEISSGQSLDASITTIKGISTGFAGEIRQAGRKNHPRFALLFPRPSCRLQSDENRFPASGRPGRNHRRQRLGSKNHDAGRTAQYRSHCRR